MTEAAVHERRPSAEEIELLAKLRAGDERAFETLVKRHYGTMLAAAQTYVPAVPSPRRSSRRPGLVS